MLLVGQRQDSILHILLTSSQGWKVLEPSIMLWRSERLLGGKEPSLTGPETVPPSRPGPRRDSSEGPGSGMHRLRA